MIQTGSAATAAGEIISTENSSEIQSLQLAAFLLTVCHVVIVVQDWFFDPNVIRYYKIILSVSVENIISRNAKNTFVRGVA